MIFEQIIDHIYPLPDGSKHALMDICSEKAFPKGARLLRAGRVENHFFFIKKGIARAFSIVNDTEITFWLGKEGDAVISMKSYIENLSGYEDIELLEDSILYQLDTRQVQLLYARDLHIANWGRKFAEKELVKTEERLIAREFRSAKERYLELMSRQPELLRRVPLGHIASYLGITQVSLSRIRSEIR